MSGIDTIKYQTTPDTEWESDKKQLKKTSHTRKPRGQPFPNRCPQGCKKHTSQYGKDRHK